MDKNNENNENNESFIFYDGPPFASGSPHMGHLLAGVIKDCIVRYHSNNKGKEFPFGWDCHGVPIESKANDILKITCRQDVIDMGIGAYNNECRKLVLSCVDKWKVVTEKMGRNIDMDHPYMTLDLDFMNSVWWVLSQLYKKNMVYHGVKIMAYSPGMECPLSNSEAGLNYLDVNDPSLTLAIPVKFSDVNCKVLVWTTTPWTLSCNLLLCVNPTLKYCIYQCNKTYEYFIARENYFTKKADYIVVKTCTGADLVGVMYQPLYNFYKDVYVNSFMIVSDHMVASDTGTGIVHIAPGFGQDDYNVALKLGLISDTILPPCPLNDKCEFISPVADDVLFGSKFVKDCDKDVIANLKQRGFVFNVGSIKHSYPYCYRTDRPLIYRTYPAWFVKVKDYKNDIVKSAESVNWYPNEVKSRYLGQMDSVVDWCISRNRFWGTPIPIWTNDEGEIIVVESSYQLCELTGRDISDIHLEHVIDLELTSPTGKSNLKHIGLVLDCWFESGSMPFAQHGYPFKTTTLNNIFPADFIAEGIDQTRGWFHSLLVISTLLYDKSPFKNVIVNGHILGVDGLKMSKKTGNYTDPEILLDKYTSDVVRLALLGSPAVKAQSYKADVKKLDEIKAAFTYMMNNCLEFWKQSLEIFNHNNNKEFTYDPSHETKDVLDNWIMQYTNKFITSIRKQLDNYQVFHLMDDVNDMIDKMSRWYIKLKKNDFKGENGNDVHYCSLSTMTTCLYHIASILTPITPHMAIKIFHTIKMVSGFNDDITTGIRFPPCPNMIDTMKVFIDTINTGRKIREKLERSHKMPVKSINIAVSDDSMVESLKLVEEYLMEELNTMEITYSTDFQKQVSYRFVPDKSIIRSKYREYKMKNFIELDNPDVSSLVEQGYCVTKYMLDDSRYQFIQIYRDCYIMYVSAASFKDGFETMATPNMVLNLDITYNEDMNELYMINCICRAINAARKDCKLKPIDNVDYKFVGSDKVELLITKYRDLILNKLNKPIEAKNEESYNYEFVVDVLEPFKVYFYFRA